MRRFQNLRGEGGFASKPQDSNRRAVARTRVQIFAAWRNAPTTPFLIASGRNIKNRVNLLKTNEKIFSDR